MTRYSAKVELRLTIGGNVLPLNQVGPDFAVLMDPPATSLGPCDGRLEVSVDGRARSSAVRISGIEAGEKRFAYSPSAN